MEVHWVVLCISTVLSIADARFGNANRFPRSCHKDDSQTLNRSEVENIIDKKINELLLDKLNDQQKPSQIIVIQNVNRRKNPNSNDAHVVDGDDKNDSADLNKQKSQIAVQNIIGRSGLGWQNDNLDTQLEQSQGKQKSQIAVQNLKGRSGLGWPKNYIDTELEQLQGKQKSQIAVQNLQGRTGLGWLNNNLDAELEQLQGKQKSQIAVQNLQGRSGLGWPNNNLDAQLEQLQGKQKSQIAVQNLQGRSGFGWPNNDFDAQLEQLQGKQKSQIAVQNLQGRSGFGWPNNDLDAQLEQLQGKQKSQIAVQNLKGRSGLGWPNYNIDAFLKQSQGKQKSQIAVQNLQGRSGLGWPNNNLDAELEQLQGREKSQIAVQNLQGRSGLGWPNNYIDAELEQLRGKQKSQIAVQNLQGRSGFGWPSNNIDTSGFGWPSNNIDTLLKQSQGSQKSQIALQNLHGRNSQFPMPIVPGSRWLNNNHIGIMKRLPRNVENQEEQKSQVAVQNLQAKSGLGWPNNNIDAQMDQLQGSQKSQITLQNLQRGSGIGWANNNIDARLKQLQGSQNSQIALQNQYRGRGLGWPNNNIDAQLEQLQGSQKSQIALQNVLGRNPQIPVPIVPGPYWPNDRPIPVIIPNPQIPVPIVPRPLWPNINPISLIKPNPQIPVPFVPGTYWPNNNPVDLIKQWPGKAENDVIIENVNGIITPVYSNLNLNQRPNLIPQHKIEQYREFLFKYIIETLIHEDVKYVIYNARTEEERAKADMLLQNYKMMIYAFTEFLHTANPLAGYIQTIRIIAQNRPRGQIDVPQELVEQEEIDETLSIHESESITDVDAWPIPSYRPEYMPDAQKYIEDISIDESIKEIIDEKPYWPNQMEEIIDIQADVKYELFCQSFNSNEVVELVQIVVNRFIVELIRQWNVEAEVVAGVAKIAVADTLHNQGVYAHKRCRNDLANRWNIYNPNGNKIYSSLH